VGPSQFSKSPKCLDSHEQQSRASKGTVREASLAPPPLPSCYQVSILTCVLDPQEAL
jgi:hypothetical protein